MTSLVESSFKSVLDSGWFQALAAFVAVNTLIYAALSLAKLIPRKRA